MVFLLLLFNSDQKFAFLVVGQCSIEGAQVGWRPWPRAVWCYAPVPECSHKCKFPSRCPITPSLICLSQPCLLPSPLKVTCYTMRKPHGSPFLSSLISSVVGAFPGFCLIHRNVSWPANVLTASLLGRSGLPFR